MKYIILTVLVALHMTLSASNASLEEDKSHHLTVPYIGSSFFPAEIKLTVLSDPSFSPEDIMCFGLTNKLNYQLVKKHYSLELTLGALRYQIKKIFRNNNSFNNAEEAIDAANLFLETYFPNENAINVFINVHLVAQGIQDSYQTFLEYVSNCFPKNENRDYFEMRKQIILMSGIYDNFCDFCDFNTVFLPPEIVTLTKLQVLKLENNHLHLIPNISTLTHLEDLDLRNNQLQAIPDISILTTLHTLYLSSNQLKTLPDLSTLTNLHTLELSHNQLRLIPPISTLTNLVFLNFNDNKLQAIPNILALTNLIFLGLRDNQLQSVPEIPNLRHFKYLFSS